MHVNRNKPKDNFRPMLLLIDGCDKSYVWWFTYSLIHLHCCFISLLLSSPLLSKNLHKTYLPLPLDFHPMLCSCSKTILLPAKILSYDDIFIVIQQTALPSQYLQLFWLILTNTEMSSKFKILCFVMKMVMCDVDMTNM